MTEIRPAPVEAQDFLHFVNQAQSPFHATEQAVIRLRKAGFEEIKEKENWNGILKRNGKYYFTRNKSAVIAFAVGGKYKPGNGFSAIGAHTDSPCLKVKPVSKKEKAGYLQVGVQLYGGGLWHTWFDRDLSVAGRVVVETADGKLESRLARIDRPILRIPTLAIHLDRTVGEGFKFNNETHLTPIISTVTKSLTGEPSKPMKPDTEINGDIPLSDKHHPILMHLLSKELDVPVDKIMDFELCLYDTQPSAIGGAYNEFIFSGRLDNLMMSYCSIEALIRSLKSADSLANDSNIRLVSLFDNEEVGSNTAHGADSNLLPSTFERLSLATYDGDANANVATAYLEALPKSYLISADMAHAVHPNYAEKHDDGHRPHMHKGVVVKINANQRYATTAPTTVILREVAKKYSVPLQEFVVRNDSPCGSTIGPMLSAKLGLRTVDVGNAQLSMHSCREVCGSEDVALAIKLFEGFFEDFPSVDARLTID
ncbi:MAG: peptidase M18 [Benniella sp.]|nr:MAG: peptidase M18 [Benniella sp.]